MARGGQGAYSVCEVADFAQAKNLAGMAVRTFGRIDTWVNAVTVSVYARFEDTSPEELHRVNGVQLSRAGARGTSRVTAFTANWAGCPHFRIVGREHCVPAAA